MKNPTQNFLKTTRLLQAGCCFIYVEKIGFSRWTTVKARKVKEGRSTPRDFGASPFFFYSLLVISVPNRWRHQYREQLVTNGWFWSRHLLATNATKRYSLCITRISVLQRSYSTFFTPSFLPCVRRDWSSSVHQHLQHQWHLKRINRTFRGQIKETITPLRSPTPRRSVGDSKVKYTFTEHLYLSRTSPSQRPFSTLDFFRI